MRLKVFLRIYGIPSVLAIILIISLSMDLPVFKTFIRLVFLGSILFSAMLNDTKYVQDLYVERERLVITYVNQFLKVKTIEIPKETISQIKFPKWIIFSGIWPPNLYVKVDGEWMIFSIFNKHQYHQIQAELASTELVKTYF